MGYLLILSLLAHSYEPAFKPQSLKAPESLTQAIQSDLLSLLNETIKVAKNDKD